MRGKAFKLEVLENRRSSKQDRARDRMEEADKAAGLDTAYQRFQRRGDAECDGDWRAAPGRHTQGGSEPSGLCGVARCRAGSRVCVRISPASHDSRQAGHS